MVDLFKDIIPSILKTGKPILSDEKDYVPFVVNTALSLNLDTILYANEMNFNNHLPKKMQYDYLLNKTRHYSRPYREWPKKIKIDDLEVIKEFYNVSISRAKEYLKLLTKDQIEDLRTQLDHGGTGTK